MQDLVHLNRTIGMSRASGSRKRSRSKAKEVVVEPEKQVEAPRSQLLDLLMAEEDAGLRLAMLRSAVEKGEHHYDEEKSTEFELKNVCR